MFINACITDGRIEVNDGHRTHVMESDPQTVREFIQNMRQNGVRVQTDTPLATNADRSIVANDPDMLPPPPTLADLLAEEREVEQATANEAEDDDLLPLPVML